MEQIKLIAVGDILLTGKIPDLINEKGVEEPLKFLKEELKGHDIILGNLETSISNKGKPRDDKCSLQSPPATIKILKTAGFNVLSLANNHIFDYGLESFHDTGNILNQNKISWFGAGDNIFLARKPIIIRVKKIKLGFLGYSWNIIQSIDAKKKKYGTAPLKKRFILNDIKHLKKEVDVVLVYLHWGYVGENYPLPSQRKLAHNMIDNGATIVLGSHPHVIQGYEEYQNGLIIYSFGNFIFPDIHDEKYPSIQKNENKESFILKCSFNEKKIINYELIPIFSNENFQPSKLDKQKQKSFFNKIESLSIGFKDKNYHKFWKRNRVIKHLPDLKYDDLLNKILFKFSKSKFNKRLIKITHYFCKRQ